MSIKIQYNAPFTIIDRAVLMSENLDVYDKTVYCILCSYASSTDRSCFPSYQTLSKKARCSRRKVIAVIANLERMGLVEKQEQFNSIGDNTSNLYIVKPMSGAGNAPPSDAQNSLPGACHSPPDASVDRLTSFSGHPFRLYEGERLDDMVESIRANGVLVPILVRKRNNILEILSGHNRVNAAKLAGLDVVPAVVLENISDAEAWIYVVETNLMQRSFSDMSHSEKAAVIAIQHSKLFSQGKRNDILKELKILENPHEYRDNETFRQLGERCHSDELLGTMYSLSSRAVSRYIRINQLIPTLKSRLDNGGFAFIPAVTLSYLKEAEQSILAKYMEQNSFTVGMKQADLLRQLSEKGKLNNDKILYILNGQAKHRPPPNRTPTVKVSKVVYAKYFKPSQSAKEIQEIVEKALELYFSK